MMSSSSEIQFDLLVGASNSLKGDYARDEEAWEGSPFQWMISLPSRSKGAFAEALISSWLTSNRMQVGRSPDSDADRIVEGVRVEIKSSTLWAGEAYRFQQLRDQNYQIVLCLGLSPFEAHLWAIPKEVVIAGWGSYEGLDSQHGGQSGTDTAWLHVDPTSVPGWLREFGGSLTEGLEKLTNELAELRS